MKVKKSKFYYDDLSNLLFMYDEPTNQYFPFMYDYNPITKTGQLWFNNPLYKQLYNYVTYVRRRPNKKTGELISLPLFIYQWVGLYLMVKATIEHDSEKFLFAWSRQGGKSEIIKIFSGFAPTFLPEYMDIVLERFSLVVGSYKEDAVKKISLEIKPYIYKAIEFYNEISEHKLVTKKDETKLTDDIFTIQINKIFNGIGDSIPYSLYKAITCGATQDGLSAHCLVIDEAGLINSELFETSVSPFLTTTGGGQFIFGVPNQNSESLFISKYMSNTTIKYKLTWKDVVKLRGLTDNTMSELYYNKISKDIKDKGENSPFIQWNFYLNPNVSSGKFITEGNLKELNILTEDVFPKEFILSTRGDKDTYIVAGFDVSIKHDYKSLTIGKTEYRDDKFYNTVLDMHTFNKNRTDRMSIDKIAEEVVKKCIEYKVDVLCFDATAIGQSLSQSLIKYMKLYRVIVSLCPFYYNSISKSKLFSYLESCMYEGTIKLLKKQASWESEKLYFEMIYMDKSMSKNNNSIINYSAPNGEEYSDDHMNSLALFNIGLKELIDRITSTDKRKQIYDDGANKFKLYLSKFKELEDTTNREKSIERMEKRNEKFKFENWCPVL